MKPLELLNYRHTVFLGVFGGASGFTGWLLDTLPAVNLYLTTIGTAAGTLTALLTTWLMLRKVFPDPLPLPKPNPDDPLPMEWPNHLPR